MKLNLPKKLPPLCDKLTLTPGLADYNNNPTWIIHDTHHNRFFHIGNVEYQIYKHWQLSSPTAMVDAINKNTVNTVEADDIKHFLLFLSENNLIKKTAQKSKSNIIIKSKNKIIQHRYLTSIIFIGILLGSFTLNPTNNSLRLPATLDYQRDFIVSSSPSQIKAVKVVDGDFVEQGQILVILHSPSIELNILKTRYEIEKTYWQLRKIFALQTELDNLRILNQQLDHEITTLKMLEKQRDELTIRARFRGYISNVEPSLNPGRWVGKNQKLMDLMNPKEAVINAFSSNPKISLIKINQPGIFVPKNINKSNVKGYVTSIKDQAPANIGQQQIPVYHMKLKPQDPIQFQHIESGTLFLYPSQTF